MKLFSPGIGETFELKDPSWLPKQRVAGKVVAKALEALLCEVKNKTKLSTLELSKLSEEIILSNNCTATFKGYKDFPEACCISVNNQLVHGIPNNYKLQEGDVVSFDLGATFEGAIADSAVTCIYGDPKSQEHMKLIADTNYALNQAISSIKLGLRHGVIGETIYSIGKKSGYGVVSDFGGHYLSWNQPHARPFISNKDVSTNGIRFQPGASFAIEPLFVIGGDPSTKIEEDKWTVTTKNISCHAEHSVYIHQNGDVEVITRRQDENSV